MKLYIVTVRTGSGSRYVDSMWVKQEHGIDRAISLQNEWKRLGWDCRPETGYWWAWSSEATVTDAKLAE